MSESAEYEEARYETRLTFADIMDTNAYQAQALITLVGTSVQADKGVPGAVRAATGEAFTRELIHKSESNALKHGQCVFADGNYVDKGDVPRPFTHIYWIIADARERAPVKNLLNIALTQATENGHTNLALSPILCSPFMAKYYGITEEQAAQNLVNAIIELQTEDPPPFPVNINIVTNEGSTYENLEQAMKGTSST